MLCYTQVLGLTEQMCALDEDMRADCCKLGAAVGAARDPNRAVSHLCIVLARNVCRLQAGLRSAAPPSASSCAAPRRRSIA
jgi:hypothetical protein